MSEADRNARLETILAAAMRAEDPVAALLAAAEHETDLETREALRRVDPDGVRMQALLIARLRFERLVRASIEAGERFEASPQEFTKTFRRYHREVPMHAFFPKDEARGFAAWEAAARDAPENEGV